MFKLFSQWMMSDYQNYENRNDKYYLKFKKDDFIHFLINEYENIKSLSKATERNYETVERIREYKEIKKKRDSKSIFIKSLASTIEVFDIIPKAGEIDLDIAQIISDLVIERLKDRNIIKLLNNKSLSDEYEMEYKYF